MSLFHQFKSLHEAEAPLLLPNAWDARSAIILQENNFQAIGTSSAAVANSLGYEDGENMSLEEYLFVVKRMVSSINVPLTVDIETGYGSTNEEIWKTIQQLTDLGVDGINIEDSVILQSQRSLKDAAVFAETISFLRNKLSSSGLGLFINVRCDAYLLNVVNKQLEAVYRLKLYDAAGADGIFLPCMTSKADIADAVKCTRLPLNVMVIPGLPDMEDLKNMGVKRISMGPLLFQKVYAGIRSLTAAVRKDGDFSSLFD